MAEQDIKYHDLEEDKKVENENDNPCSERKIKLIESDLEKRLLKQNWKVFGTEIINNIQSGPAVLAQNHSINLCLHASVVEVAEISGTLGITVPPDIVLNPLNLRYDILVNGASILLGTQTLINLIVISHSTNLTNYTQTLQYSAKATNLKCDCENKFEIIVTNQSLPDSSSTSGSASIRIISFTLSVIGPTANDDDNDDNNKDSKKKHPLGLRIYENQQYERLPNFTFTLPAADTRSIHLAVRQDDRFGNVLLQFLIGADLFVRHTQSIGIDFELLRNGKSLTNGRRPLLNSGLNTPSIFPDVISHAPFVLVDREVKRGKYIYTLNLFNTSFAFAEPSNLLVPININMFSFTALARTKEKHKFLNDLIATHKIFTSSIPISLPLTSPTFRIDLPVSRRVQKVKLIALLYFSFPNQTESQFILNFNFDILRDNESLKRYRGFQPYHQVIDSSATVNQLVLSFPILFVDEPPLSLQVAGKKHLENFIYTIEFFDPIAALMNFYLSAFTLEGPVAYN